jgi:hypothetical protein
MGRQDGTTGHALVLPELPAASRDQYLRATIARRTAGSDADACQSRTGRAMLTGQIPPTNRQRTIKKPDRRPGDQAPDLHLLVAGAGFEPATSGL